jgi:four helix bundle protein
MNEEMNREVNDEVKCESEEWSDGRYPMSDLGMGNDQVNEVTYDLEDRLIDFAVRVLRVASQLPDTVEGNHVKGQIVRSGTSPAPNYGEAQSAESRADFIHKLKICLKELRETRVWTKIIIKAEMLSKAERLSSILQENDELIRIFHTSVKTARANKE